MLFTLLVQSINGAQFLRIISLSFLSACLAAKFAPTPTTDIGSVTSKYSLPHSHKIDFKAEDLNLI